MKQQAPLLRIYLAVWGDFGPHAFGEAVGVDADWQRQRGDLIPLERPSPCSEWRLLVPARHDFDVNAAVTELLARIEGHEERLRYTAEAWNLDTALRVVAEWDARETSAPAVSFSVENLRRLVALGAAIDVDLYPLT